MEESLPIEMHREIKGKIETRVRVPLDTPYDVSLAYIPGVAETCLEIKANRNKSFSMTRRWNTVAVVSNGTSVLELGDIGPAASLPLLEGKAAVLKTFGGVDAVPVCVDCKDAAALSGIIASLEFGYSGFLLEGISAPECYEVERELKARCAVPVYNDSREGTAVAVLAALKNALKLAGKTLGEAKTVISGCGAAGTAVAEMLLKAGARDIVMCDKNGVLLERRCAGNPVLQELFAKTNPRGVRGKIKTALKGADVFIGLSAANVITAEDVATMAEKPVIFAMANPIPEIMAENAQKGGAFIYATGRSDRPNQISSIFVFPGLLRGTLDAKAKEINDEMLFAAADALAGAVGGDELSVENILPFPVDPESRQTLCGRIADAVKAAAVSSGASTQGGYMPTVSR
ncbi:MAG: NADP-dependent malic enzyme [Clostridia bacterium]|nr:NADP-dependent malic enzyme [Clostridia bacterium]